MTIRTSHPAATISAIRLRLMIVGSPFECREMTMIRCDRHDNIRAVISHPF
jgi:hypothetical protein